MANRGEYSRREIVSQGVSWKSAVTATLARRDELRALLERNADRLHVFIGCGSTYYLAQYAAPLFQQLAHRSSRAAPSSELLLRPDAVVPAGQPPLVVALSRSGETSETIMAADAWRKRGSEVLTISCYDQTPLVGALVADDRDPRRAGGKLCPNALLCRDARRVADGGRGGRRTTARWSMSCNSSQAWPMRL